MATAVKPQIEASWYEVLKPEFEADYFQQIKATLLQEKKEYTIYPKGNEIFNAFNTTPFDQVKVVILGQDPYHGPGQAHGLSFSVPDGITQPPSLKNVLKELEADVHTHPTKSGNLISWAQQGVLLLNASLTVRKQTPASHANIGWQTFTDAAIKAISDHKKNVVFMLWGGFAKKKAWLIDDSKHLILKAAHPSPFSAYNGFFGCSHFSKANAYLNEHHISPIQWQLP
ncbi:MAG: uracil-DNA glycosylase [Crocinitomicaceae bacterium]|nr:uracil-DNA glycosylase [Crocinitomicaceae bacterium]|tara:strand:- start:13809 stop:14492 length:684 start_codon:yes stop_codon:yes gene_type:complete